MKYSSQRRELLIKATALIGAGATLGLGSGLMSGCTAQVQSHNLLNVSFDPTRELFSDYNRLFISTQSAGVTVNQSHDGSAKQARSVIDGLEADIVSLALSYDIDQIVKSGLIKPDWQGRFANNSTPFSSVIVFLVRKGNKKHIKDWSDLVQPGLSLITPNPKTSGGARWNYMAALAYGLKSHNNDQARALEFVKALYLQAPVLDSGSRGATSSFTQRGLGDVLIAWESEALSALAGKNKDQFEIIYPSITMDCQTPVTYVDSVVERHQSLDLAKAYISGLYSPQAKAIIRNHNFRPFGDDQGFTPVNALKIDSFGGWQAVHKTHFAKGAAFDNMLPHTGTKA